jgi:hypothetical protein
MKKHNILIILNAIAGLILIIFSILLINNNLSSFDSSIYNYISEYINDINTSIFKVITSLSSLQPEPPKTGTLFFFASLNNSIPCLVSEVIGLSMNNGMPFFIKGIQFS